MKHVERDLAKCVDFDIQDDQHDGLYLGGHFKYEGGGCQGLTYGIDIEFVQRFMGVFGVSRLQDVNGKSCWVTHDYRGIHRISPLHMEDGLAFDIDEWVAKKQAESQKKG